MHEHHRERMRERYLQNGFDSFASHELLEMLLYYAKPRTNTNPTAHGLMERFGDIKHTMEATLDELKEVEGIGDNSAILIKLVTELTKRYCIEAYRPTAPTFTRMEEVARFVCPKFSGLDHEQLHMMLFDNSMNMLDYAIVSDGVVNSSDAPARFIAERAYKKKAAFVVLAHNHPNGVAHPSEEDLSSTEYIAQALDMLGIILAEHIVVVPYGFYPIIHMQRRVSGRGVFSSSVCQRTPEVFRDFIEEEAEPDEFYRLEPLF